MAEEQTVEESISADVDAIFAQTQQPEAEEATEEVAEEEVSEAEEDDGDDYEPDPKPVAEGDEFVEVEYEGKLYEVPAEMKEALLRQSDYTVKTQEVAEQRKAVEVALGTVKLQQQQYDFAQSIWDDVKQVDMLKANITQYQDYIRNNIEQLSSSDIEKIRFQIDETRQQGEELTNSIQSRQTEHQQALQQSQAELQKKGTEVLAQRIPGWGKETQGQVRDYALSRGYAPQQLEMATPDDVQTLYESMQYRKLQEGKAAAVKKVQAAPKIQPKSRNPMPKETQDALNLRKKLKSNLSHKDKANLIGNNLAERFQL
jgi:hypothetical protein